MDATDNPAAEMREYLTYLASSNVPTALMCKLCNQHDALRADYAALQSHSESQARQIVELSRAQDELLAALRDMHSLAILGGAGFSQRGSERIAVATALIAKHKEVTP